jgi:hypothetical protein
MNNLNEPNLINKLNELSNSDNETNTDTESDLIHTLNLFDETKFLDIESVEQTNPINQTTPTTPTNPINQTTPTNPTNQTNQTIPTKFNDIESDISEEQKNIKETTIMNIIQIELDNIPKRKVLIFSEKK